MKKKDVIVNEFSDADVFKAFKVLDILEKGMDDEDDKDTGIEKADAGEEEEEEDVEKASMKKGDEDTDDMKKAIATLAKGLEALSKTVSTMSQNGGKQTVIEKGVSDDLGSANVDIEKSIRSGFDAIDNKIDQKFKSTGQVMKGLYEKFEDMEKGQDDLFSRIDGLESQPKRRKSIQTERFIEKGMKEDLQKGNDGAEVLSLSKSRTEILDRLDTLSGISKGEDSYNKFYGNAVSLYEASNTLSKGITDDLKLNHNILIVD